jgi:anti-sigma regulatory factor (Ser/Thr protein kinase)
VSVSATTARPAWCVIVPHHASGARDARHRLARVLRGVVSPAVLADTLTVAAELISNAVRHARPLPGGVIRVALRMLGGGRLQVRVTDGGGGQPRPRNAGPDAVSGRGLAIVAALADRWGVEPEGCGRCVWAELPAARLVPV